MEHTHVINAWPSAAALARDIGERPGTVRIWRMRGIPPRVYPAIVSAAEARGIEGVTLEALMGRYVAQRNVNKSGIGAQETCGKPSMGGAL